MSDHAPPPHILAINNEQSVLDLFRDLLTDEGYRVTTQPYANKDMVALTVGSNSEGGSAR